MCLDGMDSAVISHRNCFLRIREGEQRDEEKNAGTVALLLIIFVCAGVIGMASKEGKVLIEIPLEDYDLLIAACQRWPDTEFVQVRYLNQDECPRLCGECARLEAGVFPPKNSSTW
jgi:hypothetical protein